MAPLTLTIDYFGNDVVSLSIPHVEREIAIALARACGIGARYASGHLIGEGATHAWVEFLVSDADRPVVLSLRATARSADGPHIRRAVERAGYFRSMQSE